MCLSLCLFAPPKFLFYSDAEHFPVIEDEKMNLWKMFKLMIVYAPDGNNSGIWSNSRGYRAFPDIVLYIIIFVLQEMTKGIVIDAFSTLRELKNSRIDDTENVCFICGIPKVTFERQIDRAAFDSHVKNFHHLWSYLYFVIYLWEQDKNDDDGLEHDIRHCIENNDIGWFPMNKAMQLQHMVLSGDTDSVEQKFYTELDGMENKFHNTVTGFSTYMSKSIERVTRIVESTHAANAPKRTPKSRQLQNQNQNHMTMTSATHTPYDGKSRAHSMLVEAPAPAALKIAVPSTCRPSFNVTSTFLESEQYISLRIGTITGLELSEYQYTSVSVICTTPTHTFKFPATDYTVHPHSDSVDVIDSVKDDNSVASIDFDDDIEAQESFYKNVYATNDIKLSFATPKESRDVILVQEADITAEGFDATPVPISIQVVLNETGKVPKLLGVCNFEVKDTMQHFKDVQAMEQQLNEFEALILKHENKAAHAQSGGHLMSLVTKQQRQSSFPLNGHNTIRAQSTGLEIIHNLKAGDMIPVELDFHQRNSNSKRCVISASFINHQSLM